MMMLNSAESEDDFRCGMLIPKPESVLPIPKRFRVPRPNSDTDYIIPNLSNLLALTHWCKIGSW